MPIGTTAAIIIGLSAAGGKAASDIYAAKKAGNTNDKALAAQERDSLRGQQMYEQGLALDKQRWADYVRVHEPHWQTGNQVLGNLYDLAGYQGGAPPMQTPQQPMGPGPAGMAPAPGSTAQVSTPQAGMPMPRRQQGPPPSNVPSIADLMLMQQQGRG